MQPLTIRAYLADMKPQKPGHDYDYEKRIFLADRIRERASKAELGARFLDFQFNMPNLNAPGPQSVDFFFAALTDTPREDQLDELRRSVNAFMTRLSS